VRNAGDRRAGIVRLDVERRRRGGDSKGSRHSDIYAYRRVTFGLFTKPFRDPVVRGEDQVGMKV